VKGEVVAAALVLAACQSQGTPPTPPPAAKPVRPAVQDVTAQDYPMPQLPRGRVLVTDAFGGKHPVDVEVAASRDARTRGLMWRTHLDDGKGMLFLFEREQALSFWMKNTLMPLDMIFIRSDFSIVGIVEHAEPQTLSARSPGGPSQYVLEVPADWCAKVGLKPGLKVRIEGIQGLVAEP
jgi:uncharacterized protein